MNTIKKNYNMPNLRLIICSLALMLQYSASAQQEPMSAQYIMNKLFVNPAYAGYKEQIQFVAMHRSQWIGFEGAPMTSVLSFDMPLKQNEFAIGSTLMHDRIGPSTRSSISIDFAYRFRLSNRGTLSLGLKGVADLYQSNVTDLLLTSDYFNQQDELFMANTQGLFLPNAGFGAYYFDKTSYFGLSVPRLLRNNLENKSSVSFDLFDGRQEPTIHIMAGKVWKLNRKIKMQPNVVIRSVMNAPLSFGIYNNVILFDQFTIGAFYSIKETGGFLFQCQIDKRFRVGYSIDVPLNRLIRTNFGSHELTASYLVKSKRKRIVYPRYF